MPETDHVQPTEGSSEAQADGGNGPTPRAEPAPIRPGEAAVDAERTIPEILRLKTSGAALFIMAGLAAVLLPALGGVSLTSPPMLATISVAVAGAIVGVAGLFAPPIRGIALFAGPGLLVAAVALNLQGASFGAIPKMEVLMAFVFGACWLLAVEHLHAVLRFVELGAYVTRQRLSSFRLSSVVNHFQAYGLGVVGIVVLVTAVVALVVPWMFSKGTDQVFGRSAELGSVFGMAIAAAVVFTLSGMILVFVRTVLPQRVEVEAVAYSRDRLDDMLRSSRVMEAQREALQGAGPSPRGPAGNGDAKGPG